MTTKHNNRRNSDKRNIDVMLGTAIILTTTGCTFAAIGYWVFGG